MAYGSSNLAGRLGALSSYLACMATSSVGNLHNKELEATREAHAPALALSTGNAC